MESTSISCSIIWFLLPYILYIYRYLIIIYDHIYLYTYPLFQKKFFDSRMNYTIHLLTESKCKYIYIHYIVHSLIRSLSI